jgi:hypothetical protein
VKQFRLGGILRILLRDFFRRRSGP